MPAGYIPFAKTKAERLASGDPRLSIEERYSSLWLYYFYAVDQANKMVQERFLLPDDAAVLINQLLNNMLASQPAAEARPARGRSRTRSCVPAEEEAAE